MEGQAYDNVNKAWKSTCRVLLGEEIGDMAAYEGYLKKYLEPSATHKSEISGKSVTAFSQSFCRGARFISNDEREAYSAKLKGAALSINDLKDIDSVVAALSEKICYAGNIIIGNCQAVESSDSVSNSFFVLGSSEIYDSKYIAYSDAMRYGEYVFGSNWIGETKFAIKNYETFKVLRCFESLSIGTSSDCYYVARMNGCQSCLFSFNQKNKSYLIGNLEFSRGEYAKLRGKLVDEIRQDLERKKEVPTIVDIIRDGDG